MSTTLNLSMQQTITLLTNATTSVLVQGHMGSGKSSLLGPVSTARNATPVYMDCSVLDLGDLLLPRLDPALPYTTFIPNESLGLHLGSPVVLMLDEFGKANPSVKTALLRLILEGKLGNSQLPPGSLVFATTNLGREGVGDLLPPHARNRLTCIEMRKPTPEGWLEWAVTNGVPASLLAWVHETGPALFADFRDATATDNPYIFNPARPETAFVTPRSLAAAGQWIRNLRNLKGEDELLRCALVGTLGTRAGLDLMAFLELHTQLPSLQTILADPTNAPVPNTASPLGLLVFKVFTRLVSLPRSEAEPLFVSWMTYLGRLPLEVQSLFFTRFKNPSTVGHATWAYTHPLFTAWAKKNLWMFKD